MRKYIKRILLTLLTSMGFYFLANANTHPVSLRIGGQPNGLRVVLDCKNSPKAGIYQGNNNHTLLINVMNGLLQNPIPIQNPLVKSIKIEPLGTNKSQAIINTKEPLKILKQFTLNPTKKNPSTRVVIDLKKMVQPSKTNPKKMPPQPSTKKVSLPPLRKKTIIVDAGHGGGDPGTIGKNGTLEKNVTLRCAKILADALKKTNRYDVKMTRSTDVFIPLSKRVQFSRENHGDLFISLHADSSPRTSARGLSVYTLSRVASDKEAARLAQKENKADLFMGINFDSEIPEVANILIDLTKRETMNLSISFAQLIKNSCPKNFVLPSNSHRFANFAVLRTPDIPAVLVELGFLSNPQDEKLLNSATHLKALSNHIIHAVDAFFGEKAER